ncbi:MAG: DUF4136 domain-containing protein [Reyranella sp.]|nr:DUF4136 domain-containing protein [Reyranella sp.]MDP3162308.1 DUF4136 domain-containing protein [Reyranella sp.]
MRLLRGAGAIALMFLMLACARVETVVTPFHTFAQSSPQGKTFIIMPSKTQEGSLEWATYSNLVAQKLESKGLRRVQSARAADYAVSLDYAIDSGRPVTSSYVDYGQTSSGGTSYTTGYVGNTPVTASTYTPPTYGVKGTSTRTDTYYGRVVRITIMDVQKSLAENKRVLVYEATGKSDGETGNINVVLPHIIDAMFVDWPGKSGVPQTQSIPFKG